MGRSQKYYLLHCKQCGREFNAVRSNAETCSNVCRSKFSIIKTALVAQDNAKKFKGGGVSEIKEAETETHLCFFDDTCKDKEAVMFVYAHIPQIQNKKAYYPFCSVECSNKFIRKYRPVAKVIIHKSGSTPVDVKFQICVRVGAVDY